MYGTVYRFYENFNKIGHQQICTSFPILYNGLLESGNIVKIKLGPNGFSKLHYGKHFYSLFLALRAEYQQLSENEGTKLAGFVQPASHSPPGPRYGNQFWFQLLNSNDLSFSPCSQGRSCGVVKACRAEAWAGERHSLIYLPSTTKCFLPPSSNVQSQQVYSLQAYPEKNLYELDFKPAAKDKDAATPTTSATTSIHLRFSNIGLPRSSQQLFPISVYFDENIFVATTYT